MSKFEILLNKLEETQNNKYEDLLSLFVNKYSPEIEEVDYGPFFYVYGKKNTFDNPYYGKNVEGVKLCINNKFFQEIALEHFSNEIIIWNIIKLEIYKKADWNLELFTQYKNEVSFPYILEEDKYKKTFSDFNKIVEINDKLVWWHYLANNELYNTADILESKNKIPQYAYSTLSANGEFKLEEIKSNIDIITSNFSQNHLAIKYYFELQNLNQLFDYELLSQNGAITEQFLVQFYNHFLSNIEIYNNFDWPTAINKCEFKISTDLFQTFKELINYDQNIIPILFRKTHQIEVYKRNFDLINQEIFEDCLNKNLVWDNELFQKMLTLFYNKSIAEHPTFSKYYHPYRFLSNILDKILLSEEVLKINPEILNRGFSEEEYFRFSLSEGKIYKTVYYNFPEIIKKNSLLNNEVVDNILRRENYIRE